MPENQLGMTAVEILTDLVAFPTYNDIEQAAEYIYGRLAPLGVHCRIVKRDGKTKYVVAEMGQGEPSLIFNGHIDTVPPGDEEGWSRPPFGALQEEGRLWGRGSADAKGPLAAQIAAFESLVGKLPGGRLVLLAVGEEETGGYGTQAALEDGIRAQACVVGEPTGLEIHLAHKGVLRATITVQGKAAHASTPQLGRNAVMGMAKILPALQELHKELAQRWEKFTGTPSLVVTTICGGEAENVVPESCSITLDRRLIPGENGQEAWRELEKVVEEARVRGLDVSLQHLKTIPPAYTPPEAAIIEAAQTSGEAALGRRPRLEGFNACSDMTYFNLEEIPTFIFGPGEITVAHQVDESVPVDQVKEAAAFYRQLAYTWLAR
ncbi:MAG: M20 family metallopeptidase [Limnochordia bacterium]